MCIPFRSSALVIDGWMCTCVSLQCPWNLQKERALNLTMTVLQSVVKLKGSFFCKFHGTVHLWNSCSSVCIWFEETWPCLRSKAHLVHTKALGVNAQNMRPSTLHHDHHIFCMFHFPSPCEMVVHVSWQNEKWKNALDLNHISHRWILRCDIYLIHSDALGMHGKMRPSTWQHHLIRNTMCNGFKEPQVPGLVLVTLPFQILLKRNPLTQISVWFRKCSIFQMTFSRT